MATTVQIPVDLTRQQCMDAIRLFLNDTDFDHRHWSVWDAESLETLAAMIRNGYLQDKEATKD